METSPNISKLAHRCVSFDFQQCSINNLKSDYPRLFELLDEEHMYVHIILYDVFYHILFIKRSSTHNSGMAIETVYVIYHYIRRKAIDYIRYKHILKRNSSRVRC